MRRASDMASELDRKRLGQLALLAELAAQRSASDLQAKQANLTRLSDLLTTLDRPPALPAERQIQFTASGAAQRWHIWQVQERRRLGILAARARLATDAARRAHARAEARRRVLEKLCKPK